jgi:type VI secretion system protein ImpA
MDLEQLLSEVASDPPCGPDLEYDSEFLAFDQLSQGKPEQQYGDTVIPAEDPDWRTVDRAAGSLLQRSKDFRVASVLTRAWTRMHGMTGFADGLALTQGLLDRYWDAAHPRLEIDGEYDPVPRANALNILGNADGLLRDFRASALIQGVGAPILVREAESILGAGANDNPVMSRSQLATMLVNAHASGHPDLLALLRAQEILKSINQTCLDKLGPESTPDFNTMLSLIEHLLHPILNQQQDAVADETGTVAEVSDMDSGPGPEGAQGAPRQISGEIRSRQDVDRVLNLVCAYLERHEPTNPAPLLIRRAQRMMAMDFMAIINELAPDSISQVRMVTGSTENS